MQFAHRSLMQALHGNSRQGGTACYLINIGIKGVGNATPRSYRIFALLRL